MFQIIKNCSSFIESANELILINYYEDIRSIIFDEVLKYIVIVII